MRGLLTIAACVAVLVPRPAAAAAQEDLAEFQLAMNAYDTGEYETAEERFRGLLEREPPLDNKALIFEVHKYLGATLMFMGKEKEANEQFEALLRQDPDYEMDPVIFPTAILDAFYKVKLQISEELLDIKKKKEQETAIAKAKKEAMKKKLIAQIKEASKPVYLEKQEQSWNLFFALVPFGVGQLQNGHAVKGYLFLGGELALLAADITLWGLSEYFKKQYYEVSSGRRSKYRNSFNSYKLATNIVAGAAIAAMVAGVIDAVIYYARLAGKGPAWKPMDAGDVPPEFRKPPLEIPEGDIDVILGLSYRWTF